MTTNKTSTEEQRYRLRLGLLSLVAAIVTIGLKFQAYHLTGSIGLFSDAVESTANLVAALSALFALWYAARPADQTHHYGHEKIEYFASGVEGGLILVAAGVIAWTAVGRFWEPVMPESLGVGLALVTLASVINLGVGYTLVRLGRRMESIVLEADGQHLLTDVWTTAAVGLGLLLVAWTRQPWLDPLLALVVALNILRVGMDLLRRSFDGLMDRALTDRENARIRAAIEAELNPGMAYHALRTRRAGRQRFMDYHLLVPGDYPVARAHDREMAIGDAIREIIPGIEITAHIEPVEEPQAWNDHISKTQSRHGPG
ncbi:cation diffusion facilitator family transporter [soil metagenome]